MKNENKMKKDLFLAAESGDVQRIQNLYREDSHVLDYVTFQGDTPLHIAARKGHLHLVRWILDRQPSLAQLQNEDKNRPLHEAAKSGNRELVEILLPHKQRFVYDCNEFGETALMIASKYGHVETVRLLLDAKSEDKAFGKDLHNRVLEAVYRLRIEKFEWEVSVRQAAYRGYTDIVVEMLHHQRGKGIRGILSPSFPKTPILHSAVQGGHLEVVEAILNHDSWSNDSMTEKDEYGRCAVHVAAMTGRWDIINRFLSERPDCITIRIEDHKSVLHLAVEYNQLLVVENLLRDKDTETVTELVSRDHDRYGNTALHLAVTNGVNRQIVEYLLSLPGVDVNALNDEGMTALDIAQQNPNCDIIVQKLETAGGIRSSRIPKSNTSSDPSNHSKQGMDKDTVQTQMIVASLIATVTFAAIFQIPGGIEDDKNSIHYGAAKLAHDKFFRIFLFTDTLAFTASLTVVFAWLAQLLFRYNSFARMSLMSSVSGLSLLFSILWTAFAFVYAAIIEVIPHDLEKLKSKDKHAFSDYEWLRVYELSIAFIPLLLAGIFGLLGRYITKRQTRLVINLLVELVASAITFAIIRVSRAAGSRA